MVCFSWEDDSIKERTIILRIRIKRRSRISRRLRMRMKRIRRRRRRRVRRRNEIYLRTGGNDMKYKPQ